MFGRFSRHSWAAKESMPFLPSTGSIATSTRICGVIWIIALRFPRGAVMLANPRHVGVTVDAQLATTCTLESNHIFIPALTCRADQFHELRLGFVVMYTGGGFRTASVFLCFFSLQ